MAWTATLIAADPDPNNRQNIKAHVQLTDGKETIDIYPLGNDLDDTNLKAWLHTIIARNLAARDVALPKLKALVGQSVTYTEPPDTRAIDAARRAVRAIVGIQQLKAASSDAAILTALTNRSTTLQGQVKTYLQANPGVNIEDLF